MEVFGLECRHKKLLHEVGLVIKALQNPSPTTAENCLIILSVARDSDTRMEQADAPS